MDAFCKVKPVSNRGIQTGFRWMAWPVRLLSLAALAIAGYLFWSHVNQAPLAGCDPTSGFDCDAALASRWSQWLGIPVLWIGAACYAAIFASSWGLARQLGGVRSVAWGGFVGATMLAAGAGLWFLGLQLLGRSAICPYCIAIHSCGLIIATIVGLYFISLRTNERRQPFAAGVIDLRATLGRTTPSAHQALASPWIPSLGIPIAGAAIALLALVGGQLAFVPKQYLVREANLAEPIDLTTENSATDADNNDESPSTAETDGTKEGVPHSVQKVGVGNELAEERVDAGPGEGSKPAPAARTVEFLDGKLKIDTYEHPILGNPEAEFVILEFFDYTCPHCRKTHALIEESLPKYGDRLAIVMLPVPNDILCNKYVQKASENHRGACKLANLAVATADLDLKAFAKVHDWIMKHENTPSYASSLSQASKHVDQTQVLERLAREDVPERVQRYIELFVTLSRAEKLTLPAQVIGNEIVTGSIESAEELQRVWEEKLGITPAN